MLIRIPTYEISGRVVMQLPEYGHDRCFTQATNGAGLTASVSSAGYLMDSSQPGTGTVYDGEREMPELDYSSSMSSVSAWWRGFSDPHSGISEYRWAIGSSAGCTDVQGFQTVGTATGMCVVFTFCDAT